MNAKKTLSVLLCLALTGGAVGVTASATDTEVNRTNYTEMLEELGYTFTLSGVHITETGYYTLEGAKVDSADDADVEVTDVVNKKMRYLNGTTWNDVSRVFEVEHTAWEKEAVGVYIAGVKITETGSYNNDGSALEDGPIYVDIENKIITLDGADISLTTGEMTLLENIVDPDYTGGSYQGKSLYDNITGVPGALVITEGTYNTPGSGAGGGNWDCYYYLPIGYETDYKFGSIALGIMADDESGDEYEDWTLELVGDNKITVNSAFGMPQQIGYVLDAPAYGIFAEANLTITGTGSLEAVADNKWDFLKAGYKNYYDVSSAGAIWSKGDLAIEGGTVTASVSTTGIKNDDFGIVMTGNNTAGTIGAMGAVTISGKDTVVNATSTTTQGIAIRAGSSITITNSATVEAESVSGVAGVAIAANVSYGYFGEDFPVTISGGANVTATATSTIDNAEYALGIGIGGSVVTVENAILEVSGEAAGVAGESVTISGGNVKVEVTNENGTAVEAEEAEISSGSYSTAIPSDFIAEGSAVVNDVIANEIPAEWAIKLGDKNYYTNISYSQKAIDNLQVDKYASFNNVIWFNESATVSRSGLELGDVITLYVKHGEEVDADFTGDRLMAQLEIVEGAEVEAAVLEAEAVEGYDAYIYTMVVDPEKALIKVVREGAEDRYFNEFGYTFYDYTAWGYAQEGDTIIILDDMSYTNTTNSYSGGWIDIEYPVTIDLNGHTISSNQQVFSVGFRTEGTVTITDSSKNKTGAVIIENDIVNQAAVVNGTKSTIVINGGSYSTNRGEVIRNTGSGDFIINDGEFTGTIYTGSNNKYTNYKIYGGVFSVDPSELLTEEYAVAQYPDGRYAVVKAATIGNNTIKVEFEDVTAADARGEKVYNINLVADTDKVINRLNSADLTFVLNQISGNNAFEIIDIADDKIAVNNVEGDRYEFHFETKTDVENDTANTITIAQVKVTGYGKYSFAVKEADTNAAHATEALDNIVDTYTPDGDTTAGEGYLDIGEGTGEVEIFAPTQNLTIKVAFPNTVENNALAYQAMNVTVTGEDIADISIDLGTDNTGAALTLTNKTNAAYTVAFDDAASVYTVEITNALTANTAYNVTVTGEGYRTARYTVNTQETDKVLNFWNNVKDNAVEVEEDKASSAKNVTFLAGDIVKDSTINIYDLSAVVSYFGEIDLNVAGTANAYAKYDLNRDGKIDSKDVAYVLVSWGN